MFNRNRFSNSPEDDDFMRTSEEIGSSWRVLKNSNYFTCGFKVFSPMKTV
jgi:hypothetical protein